MKSLSKKSGWSISLMQQASEILGYEACYHKLLFPGGLRELHDFYDRLLDNQMQAILDLENHPTRIRDKISLALQKRIIHLGDDYLHSSAKSIWLTSDAIWRYAGDTSVDFNYYTKRSILSAIYVKTKIHFSKDSSENHSYTKHKIDNSIETLLSVFSIKHKISKIKVEDIPILRLFW